MKLNKTLFLTALVGALGTSGVALADHRWERSSDVRVRDHRTTSLDVIGSSRLRQGRGEIAFAITPEMRRDGLQLLTDARNLRILAVEFEYSDGRVVRLAGRQVRHAQLQGPLMTIQRGRPPGLRNVRVQYVMRRDPSATLQLVQIHDGDGYTHEEDLWENQPRHKLGYFPRR